MEGIAPLGTLDPQHVIAQLAKALADPARAFAILSLVTTEVRRPSALFCYFQERTFVSVNGKSALCHVRKYDPPAFIRAFLPIVDPRRTVHCRPAISDYLPSPAAVFETG